MARKSSYKEQMKQEYSEIIDTLTLNDLQRRFIRSRWLDQVLWLDGRADHSRSRYYFLRLTSIIGGVTIPTLLAIYLVNAVDPTWRWVTLAISVLVALTASVEEFFHYGERWRHYRRMAEWLKIEGWKFFQMTEPYNVYKSHTEAYTVFANQVEAILQQDVEGYVSGVVQQSNEKSNEKLAKRFVKRIQDV
jgi:hypothetical protein